jgi:integrase
MPPESDFWAVYDVAEGQDQVLVLACLNLAARRGEILALRWEDVDFHECRVRLFTRKRKDGSLEGDWLPMTDELYEALVDHKQKVCSEWVFPNPETALPYIDPRKILKRLCKKARVKPFGFHAIRHLTASILAKNDVPLVDIQAILRHQRLSTTEKYIRQLRSVRPALRLLSRKKKPTISPHRNPQNRVGGGVTPAASHTTGHTVPYHGGSC